jgi:hypothetical protein
VPTAAHLLWRRSRSSHFHSAAARILVQCLYFTFASAMQARFASLYIALHFSLATFYSAFILSSLASARA